MIPAEQGTAVAVGLAATRVAGMAVFAPIVAAPAVPWRLRAGIAVVLGAAAVPAAAAAALPAAAVAEPWRLLPMAVVEFALGAAIGVLAMLPVAAFRTGGSLAGMQSGVGFGQSLDGGAMPEDGDEDPMGQLLALFGAAVFAWAGGLEAVALATVRSFDWVALGGWAPGPGVVGLFAGAALAASELALRVAMPVTVVLVAESLVSGVIARAVPGVGPLSFGFPLRFAAALMALLAGVAAMQSAMHGAIDGMLDSIRIVAGGVLR